MIGRFVSTATLGVAVVVADEIQDVTCAAPKVVDGDDESCLLQVKTATEYEAGVQSGAEIEAEEEMARAYTDYADSKLMQEGEEGDGDWSDYTGLKLMQEGEEDYIDAEAAPEMTNAFSGDIRLNQEGEEHWSGPNVNQGFGGGPAYRNARTPGGRLLQEGEEAAPGFGNVINAQDQSSGPRGALDHGTADLLQEGEEDGGEDSVVGGSRLMQEERGPKNFDRFHAVQPGNPRNFNLINKDFRFDNSGKGEGYFAKNYQGKGSNILTREQNPRRQRDARTFQYVTGNLLQEGEEEEMAFADGETESVVAKARLIQEGEEAGPGQTIQLGGGAGPGFRNTGTDRLIQEGEEAAPDQVSMLGGGRGPGFGNGGTQSRLIQEGEEDVIDPSIDSHANARLMQEGEHAGAESEEERKQAADGIDRKLGAASFDKRGGKKGGKKGKKGGKKGGK